MITNIIKTLLVILFFFLPLINSHLLDLIWIKWGFYVGWNYEFTKVMFFNIFSGIILTLFFIKSLFLKDKLKIPKIIFPLILILFVSTIFSDYTYNSLLWNTSKAHSLIMFLNLIWLFIVFINQKINFKKKLIFTIIISSIFVWIIWIKEYYFPTFDYWNLSNRALSTFWHPNYLALYILILVPFLIEKIINFFLNEKINILYLTTLTLLVFLLFLTKSIWWILIFLLYILYIIYSKNKKKINKKYLSIFIIFSIIILSTTIYKFWLITKLNSFISRFYIWETTIKIIFSETKNIIFGSWIWTLDFVFDSYKVPELYIFENIGFTADRAHNLILHFFYNFWVWWLIFIIYSIYKLIKNYKNSAYFNSIILFLIFTIFNFASISHYLIIILIISIIYNTKSKNKINKNKIINFIKKILSIFFITILLIISIYWSYISYYNYKSEYYKYTNNYYIEKHFLINWRENETWKYIWKYIPSANEYLYRWNLHWESWNKKDAILNYNKWLKLLPDMWNKNSKYYKNYFIKKLFVPERFYSKKFSNLKEILKRVWEK